VQALLSFEGDIATAGRFAAKHARALERCYQLTKSRKAAGRKMVLASRLQTMARPRTYRSRARSRRTAAADSGSGDDGSGQGDPDPPDPPRRCRFVVPPTKTHNSPLPWPRHGCCRVERGRAA
jgi:hypothetical protein